jgi:hypothetical protein
MAIAEKPRTASRTRWTNWAETVCCWPERVFYPRSRDDLVAIVRQARREGKKVRAVGAGHSWSALAATDDYLVCVSRLRKVAVDLADPRCPRVTLESGATVRDVNRELALHGLALPTNVVLESVEYGGLIATGCHGSGWDMPTLSDFVHAMEVVTATEDVRTFCAETDDPTVMNAARLHLGLFGIIYRLTLNVVPTFRVHQVDCRLPMEETIHEIRDLVTSHEYVDLYWWPFADTMWVKMLDRTTAPRTARPRQSIWSSAVSRLEIEGGRLAYEWLRGAPAATPKACPRLFRFTASRRDCVVDVVDAVHYQKWIERMKVECTEFAFPVDAEFARVRRAWSAVVEAMHDFARQGQFPFNLTLNARFIQGSRALLSPAARAEHTCYIEILSYYQTPGWREFAVAVAREWMRLPGARPHWAKDFAFIPDITPFIRAAYGENLASFLRIRDDLEVDPNRMFVNDLMHDLFFRA